MATDAENKEVKAPKMTEKKSAIVDMPVPPPVIPRHLPADTFAPETPEPTSYPSFLQEPVAPPVLPEVPLLPEHPTVNTSVLPPVLPFNPSAVSEEKENTEFQSSGHTDAEYASTETTVRENPPQPPVLPEATDSDFVVVEPDRPVDSDENEPEIEPVAPPVLPHSEFEAPVSEPTIEESETDSGSETESTTMSAPAPDLIETQKSETLSEASFQPAQPPHIPAPKIPASEIVTEETHSPDPETTAEAKQNEEKTDPKSTEETPHEPVTDYRAENFLSDLFSNENTCITAPNGAFPLKEEWRALLALFSNGRFFVNEAARNHGYVWTFTTEAKKKRFQIGRAEYVPAIVLNDIYEYAARQTTTSLITPVVETDIQEQVRMQRDFVTIVSRAAAEHVSDIHIVVADHTTVMFRVNGLMQTEMEYNKEWGESFVRAAFASSDISDANYAQNEYQAAQKLGRTPLRGSGGKLSLPHNVLGIRLQFNPIAFGSRYVVMRLLYAEEDSTSASDLEALGFTKKETDLFYQMRAFPTGIIVVSGPTGSGKSTTLQRNMIAMLSERNYEINLITVEDPPEYPIPGARQMPVTNATIEEAKDREFTKALSAALRSDPDALMIGEIRTLSAADLAFRGALSGHNVWTTLHANSASAILMRLKDIGVEDFKLQDPSIIKGLMAQRLFRKVCPFCRVKATERLDHPAVQRLRRAFGDVALDLCYLRGPGCENCDNRGVKGRTVVAEFILPDATFLNLSLQGESKKALDYWINDLNGVTLREAAISRMLQGIIDIEEVERWTGFLDQQTLA